MPPSQGLLSVELDRIVLGALMQVWGAGLTAICFRTRSHSRDTPIEVKPVKACEQCHAVVSRSEIHLMLPFAGTCHGPQQTYGAPRLWKGVRLVSQQLRPATTGG